MTKRMTRADLRGEHFDEDCYLSRTTTNEFGQSDHRVFCYGSIDKTTDEPLDKCKECGAYVWNATPLEEISQKQTKKLRKSMNIK